MVYLIHDRAAQFNFNYSTYSLKEIRISINAPNMNALADRFVGSVRLEALDYYLFFSEMQILHVLQEYIGYSKKNVLIRALINRSPGDINLSYMEKC